MFIFVMWYGEWGNGSLWGNWGFANLQLLRLIFKYLGKDDQNWIDDIFYGRVGA